MKNMRIYLTAALFNLFFIASCQPSKKNLIIQKNQCFQAQLDRIKISVLYKEVYRQFSDTFSVMQSDVQAFGVPQASQKKIDSAIFFNTDSSLCLMMVLLKPNDVQLTYGEARLITGHKKDSKWIFDIDREFMFDKEYVNLFPGKGFADISLLARYDVLKEGNIQEEGCALDEKYWFSAASK